MARALKLYEIQLAIICCQRPAGTQTHDTASSSEQSGYILHISERLFRGAMICAYSRMLDHIECNECSAAEGRLERLATNANYREVFAKFHEQNGWTLLRGVRSSNIQGHLEKRMIYAADTAKIVGLSAHFRRLPQRPKLVGGVNAARAALEMFKIPRDQG